MDTVEGTLTVGTAVKWFSVLAKRGEGNWNPTVVVEENTNLATKNPELP